MDSMKINWSAISIVVGLFIQISTFIWYFSRLNSKFESHEKEDLREMQVVKDSFVQQNKYVSEFFDRITKLEIISAAQIEINKNTNENYREIKEALKSIEALIRDRGIIGKP